jgi:hypothetical protein
MTIFLKYIFAPLFYFLIITPIALISRLFKINFLILKPQCKKSFWIRRAGNKKYEKQI